MGDVRMYLEESADVRLPQVDIVGGDWVTFLDRYLVNFRTSAAVQQFMDLF